MNDTKDKKTRIDTEPFPKGTPKESMERERQMRLKAGGAISSEYTGSPGEGWTLTTEWEIY